MEVEAGDKMPLEKKEWVDREWDVKIKKESRVNWNWKVDARVRKKKTKLKNLEQISKFRKKLRVWKKWFEKAGWEGGMIKKDWT